MEQIQALIQLSNTCSQSIGFGCRMEGEEVEVDNTFGWWLDKSGEMCLVQIFCEFANY